MDHSGHHTARVIVGREDAHWSAVVPAFTIAGRGDTRDEAIANAHELLAGYLRCCERDGMTIFEARRPVSRAWSLGLRARLLLRRAQSVTVDLAV